MRFSFSFPLIFAPSNQQIVKFCVRHGVTRYKTTFYPKYCDTCDSKKVKTPVDARAYVRARGDIIGLFTIQFLVFQFALFRVVHSPSIAF